MSYPFANSTVINNFTSLKSCTVGHITFIRYNAFCDSPKNIYTQAQVKTAPCLNSLISHRYNKQIQWNLNLTKSSVQQPLLYICSFSCSKYDSHWLIGDHVTLHKFKCIPIGIHFHQMYPERDTLR